MTGMALPRGTAFAGEAFSPTPANRRLQLLTASDTTDP